MTAVDVAPLSALPVSKVDHLAKSNETSYPACHQPEGQHSSPSFTTRHPFTKLIGLFVTAFFPEKEDACHKINYGYIEIPVSQFSCMMGLLREFGRPLCIFGPNLERRQFCLPWVLWKIWGEQVQPLLLHIFFS